MKFTLNHTRALMGTDISISVEADEGKAVQGVRIELDGFDLAYDKLTRPSDSYERTFLGAGTAGHGTEHTLVVSAEQDDATTHSSTSVWVDSN